MMTNANNVQEDAFQSIYSQYSLDGKNSNTEDKIICLLLDMGETFTSHSIPYLKSKIMNEGDTSIKYRINAIYSDTIKQLANSLEILRLISKQPDLLNNLHECPNPEILEQKISEIIRASKRD